MFSIIYIEHRSGGVCIWIIKKLLTCLLREKKSISMIIFIPEKLRGDGKHLYCAFQSFCCLITVYPQKATCTGVYVNAVIADIKYCINNIHSPESISLGVIFFTRSDIMQAAAKANNTRPIPSIMITSTGMAKLHLTTPIPPKNIAISGLII